MAPLIDCGTNGTEGDNFTLSRTFGPLNPRPTAGQTGQPPLRGVPLSRCVAERAAAETEGFEKQSSEIIPFAIPSATSPVGGRGKPLKGAGPVPRIAPGEGLALSIFEPGRSA